MNRRFYVFASCARVRRYSRLLNLHPSSVAFDGVDFLPYTVVNVTVLRRIFLTLSFKRQYAGLSHSISSSRHLASSLVVRVTPHGAEMRRQDRQVALRTYVPLRTTSVILQRYARSCRSHPSTVYPSHSHCLLPRLHPWQSC